MDLPIVGGDQFSANLQMLQARHTKVILHICNYAKNFHVVIVGRHKPYGTIMVGETTAASDTGKGR
jgi:hypothetical protein